MLKIINYEQLAKSVVNIYKVPKAHLQEFESLFWQTLGALTVLVFLQFLIPVSTPEQEISGAFTVLSFLLYAGMIFVMVPFSVDVIRKFALNKNPKENFAKALYGSEGLLYIIKLWLTLAVLIGVILLSMLPAGLSLLMIEMGSSSNIFTSFSNFLMTAGGFVSLYVLLRLCPKFIFAAIDQDITIGSAFEKSQGHVLAMLYIIILAVIPPLLITSFLSFSLHNVILMMENIYITFGIQVIRSIVISAGYLVSLYLVWGALTEYMLEQKIIMAKK